MHRKAKRTCFKFTFKILALGITTCTLIALLGPCLSIRLNLVAEKVGYTRHVHDDEKLADELIDQLRGQKQPIIRENAIEDKKVVLKNFKTNISAPLEESKVFQPKPDNITRLSWPEDVMHKRRGSAGYQGQQFKNETTHFILQKALNTNLTSILQSSTQLEDIFIGVKSGAVNHKKRLDLLLETWITRAQNQVILYARI